jgi:predicted RNA-binding Zn-ribbon protein involved in translation (DUF1610 family)
MQTVKASCPECGKDAFLLPGDITVTVHLVNPDLSTFSFTCPKCGNVITKPAPDDVRNLFALARGVRWNVIRPPAELEESHDGPPLTLDDLIDLMMELEKM